MMKPLHSSKLFLWFKCKLYSSALLNVDTHVDTPSTVKFTIERVCYVPSITLEIHGSH